ncbi:MAG: AAA family ATPase [Bacteroidota bacterium]
MPFNIREDYVLPAGLQEALDGAIHLNRPLLLTGEPGTGKTSLADWAAGHLHDRYAGADFAFSDTPLKFSTKTTSQARDLFYAYDALSHFQAANLRGTTEGAVFKDYLELQALGRAIAYSNPTAELATLVNDELPKRPTGHVVLIDEVDKAPRDFTNDVLDEIDKLYFRLREQGNYQVERGAGVPIVIIMTSNSEKNLPDAFLRRCAFFHIEFPQSGDPKLRLIVENHLGAAAGAKEVSRGELIDFFYQARDAAPRKKPATAELLGWLELLELADYHAQDQAEQERLLATNLGFLVKTQEDLAAVRNLTK